MSDIVPSLVEYGIALVALYMMYSITYNHLTQIQKTLIEIKEILSRD
jgi:hypothetical protein